MFIKKSVATLLCMAIAGTAFARMQDLNNAISPNKNYTVVVSEDPVSREITYQILNRQTHTPLYNISASYQHQEGELKDWTWQMVIGTEVAWSPDSHFVCIDEYPHQYDGGIFLLAIKAKSVTRIPVPAEDILTATQQKWDRHRVRMERGWIDAHTLSVEISGTAPQPDDPKSRDHKTYQLLLHIQNGKAAVTQCHAVK